MATSKFAELKEKEKQARKQIVVESALTLFAKKPFYEVGMRDVADEAGVSPATLYRYFPSQEDLFNEAFLQDISLVSEEFDQMVNKEKPATIEEFASKFVGHLIENESSFQMMAYLMMKNDLKKPVIGKFGSITKNFFDSFAHLLERYGVETTMARLHSHSFIASITGILMTFKNHPKEEKSLPKDHIMKLVKLTASLYNEQLIKS
ncbi:MAG: TetR/AcrR family transcriptional regulator [Desulfobacteraceae bacterium]|nr:MAG: TetR/AcrR family transcriptional regulator [Desulfobacteraceae bacterium]